jgi:hypothetical protein
MHTEDGQRAQGLRGLRGWSACGRRGVCVTSDELREARRLRWVAVAVVDVGGQARRANQPTSARPITPRRRAGMDFSPSGKRRLPRAGATELQFFTLYSPCQTASGQPTMPSLARSGAHFLRSQCASRLQAHQT